MLILTSVVFSTAVTQPQHQTNLQNENKEENIDLSCKCGAGYRLFGRFGILFFIVYNWGDDTANAPFTTDIYDDKEKIATKTHFVSIPPNTPGRVCVAFISHNANGVPINTDINITGGTWIHVDGTDKFDEIDEDNNWCPSGVRD
jgi:hypothetical protein